MDLENTRVIDLVKDNTVRFLYARKGELWYETDREKFTFPVQIEDMEEGTFLAEDKAMIFMKYIKKQLEFAKISLSDSAY